MASSSTLINKFGKMAGWNSVTVNVLGRDVEGITELEYSDSVELENAKGSGKYPCGRAEGNYEAKASITLYAEEVIALQSALPRGKRLSDIAPFDIIVEYEYNDLKVKDVIHNCQFKGRSVAAKQSDKTITNKLELVVSHIEWAL